MVVLSVEEGVAEEDAGKVQLWDGGGTLGELPVLHVQNLRATQGSNLHSNKQGHHPVNKKINRVSAVLKKFIEKEKKEDKLKVEKTDERRRDKRKRREEVRS